jgi:protein-S-isoprenylcysteine O-methyltransferase Ste14
MSAQEVKRKLTDYVMLLLSYLIGAVSMVGMMIFLFNGSLNLVPLGLSETAALWLNAFLCLAFFAQHSIMIRRSFRRMIAKSVGELYHGPVYTIASGVALLILVLFWQESAHILASPKGILRWLLRGVFFLSFGGFFWGLWALDWYDPFGNTPILRRLRGKAPPQPMPFHVRGPYRWIRHPLYLFVLLLIWSCPNLTVDRLLFNILFTAWMIVATLLEERDLIADFGETYRDYQRKVPMLVPWRIPRRNST